MMSSSSTEEELESFQHPVQHQLQQLCDLLSQNADIFGIHVPTHLGCNDPSDVLALSIAGIRSAASRIASSKMAFRKQQEDMNNLKHEAHKLMELYRAAGDDEARSELVAAIREHTQHTQQEVQASALELEKAELQQQVATLQQQCTMRTRNLLSKEVMVMDAQREMKKMARERDVLYKEYDSMKVANEVILREKEVLLDECQTQKQMMGPLLENLFQEVAAKIAPGAEPAAHDGAEASSAAATSSSSAPGTAAPAASQLRAHVHALHDVLRQQREQAYTWMRKYHLTQDSWTECYDGLNQLVEHLQMCSDQWDGTQMGEACALVTERAEAVLKDFDKVLNIEGWDEPDLMHPELSFSHEDLLGEGPGGENAWMDSPGHFKGPPDPALVKINAFEKENVLLMEQVGACALLCGCCCLLLACCCHCRCCLRVAGICAGSPVVLP
jgi:hypothetical protein